MSEKKRESLAAKGRLRRPEKVGERVIMPDGSTGYVALVHPTIPDAVFVQPDTPDMVVHMREDLGVLDGTE